MRALVMAAVLTAGISVTAWADQTVAGHWQTKSESGVSIIMNVTPDGGWDSETMQNKKLVRKMEGTYKQAPKSDGTGTLVFTPTKATGGKSLVETDEYELAQDGKQLKLTSGGDTMVFEKH